MPPSKRDVEILRALCGEVHADDGTNPRDDEKHGTRRRTTQDRKLQQLCKQVSSALQLVLPSLEHVAEAQVIGVVPAPNAGRLRVVLSVRHVAERDEIAARLHRYAGRIRTEVVQAISRRRAPELVFRS